MIDWHGWVSVIFDPTSWINGGIGVVVGLLGSWLWKLLVATFQNREMSITRHWHSYKCTYEHDAFVCLKYEFEIDRGWLGQIQVTGRRDGDVVYKGHARTERGHLLLSYNATTQNQPESVHERYVGDVGLHPKLICGLWLSYDYSAHVACGVTVLSDRELMADELKEIFKNRYSISNSYPLIRMI